MNNNELLFRLGTTPQPGMVEPTYNRYLVPLFGSPHGDLHPQATLQLPHPRGFSTTRVALKNLPRKGDCNKSKGRITGVYAKPGPIFYSDYEGQVYHRIPLELCTQGRPCQVKKLIGRMEGSDSKLYHVYTCIDGCIFFERAKLGRECFFFTKNVSDAPLWVQSCSDKEPKTEEPKMGSSGVGKVPTGARSKMEKTDRMTKGKIVLKPEEKEKDIKKKAPDATIVVEGVKYQVTKKGKIKNKETKDGLYHNRNKPQESRKKLEKALLAWAIICSIFIVPAFSTNVTQWNLWDNSTKNDIHSFMFRNNITRSLHGIWPDDICHGKPSYLAKDYELRTIAGMLDSSETTNFSCCKLQRHEWNKHGWCNWFNIEPWLKDMNQTQANITKNENLTECAATCRYDNSSDLNIVLQARNSPTFLVGCKRNKNFSFSGDIREKPCNREVTAEEIMLMSHDCHTSSSWTETIVDEATEVVEKTRKAGVRTLSWMEKTIKQTRIRLFGADASPYCNITRIVGNVIYTKNCTPACLPDSATVIGPGAFDLAGQARNKRGLYIPTGVYNEFIIITLIAISEYAPETASLLYLLTHYCNTKLTHPLMEEGCDTNQLNLTANRPVHTVVPKQFYFLGKWSCIKPSWWPYWSEAEEVLFDLEKLIEITVRLVKEVLMLWEDLTAVAFIAGIIKLIQGRPIHALIWVLLLSSAQAWELPRGISCRDQFKYALATNTTIGLLGASNLTTHWEDYKLDDGQIMAKCENGRWIITPKCKYSRTTWLAEKHERALPTSVNFISIHNASKQGREERLNRTMGVCPCDSTPVEKSSYTQKFLTIAGSAFNLECPINWQGKIECTSLSKTTLFTGIIVTYVFNGSNFLDKTCKRTKKVDEYERICTIGGNDTCVTGNIVQAREDLTYEYCNWCGYRFTVGEGLPHWPIGYCKTTNYTGLVESKLTNCTINGVEITTSGKIECLIGNIKVKTKQINNELKKMPCKPIKIGSDTKYATGKNTCTYNWSEVHPNKFYEEIDQFWQQYIVKDGYQYWFDLQAGDHRSSYFSECIVIVIIALLGGRTVLWLVVALHLVMQAEAWFPPHNSVAESFMFSYILIDTSFEVITHFMLLIIILYDKEYRNLIITIFFFMVSSFKTTLLFIFLCIFGVAQAEEQRTTSDYTELIYQITLILIGIAIMIKKRNFSLLTIAITTLIFRSCIQLPLDYTLLPTFLVFVLFYIVASIYYVGRFRKGVMLILSMLFLYGCIGILKNFGNISSGAISMTIISWPRVGIFLSLYLISVTWSITEGIDIMSWLIMVMGVVMTLMTMALDIVIIWTLIPWYNIVKLYYVKKKVKETKREWNVHEQVYKNLLDDSMPEQWEKGYSHQMWYDHEGVHQVPVPDLKTIDPLVWVVLKSMVLASCITVWKPIVLLYCVIELSYWAHLKFIKELSGVNNFISRLLAAIIECSWRGTGTSGTILYKTYLLSSQINNLIIKHKVNNTQIFKWFKEEEVFGMPKVYMVTAIRSLTKENAILCTVCENRNGKRKCPKCGCKGTPIKCGMTLAEFEEKFYSKIFITDEDDGDYRVEEPGKIVRYRDLGLLYLRNLPILATKQKLMMVGNLGSEVADLEHLGWTIRGPAVCKKIVKVEKCQTTMMDKLTAFFGIMPRGATPRAPTRFPISLLRIKRGFENGWAYTHPGGVSSVHHVTEGKDLYISDELGRTRITCQNTNKTTDETEYGIKTDNSCSDGTRCYAFNPEAVNISGTKGAMIHLKKAGSEFNCVTAMGLPAYFDLKHLKGWSGLPIFEASNGRIVGRIKAGKNKEGDPTVLMSGVQVAKPTECDLDSIVMRLSKMQRGEFKQVTLATGAGKTTELPKRIIEEIGRHKRILVLIPLRAAAEGVYRYMQCKHPSISFNLRIGELKEGDMSTGITYASYGYFCQMDMPRLKTAITGYNFVFMDEYHCATAEQLAVMSKIHRFSEEVRVVAMTATPAGTVSRVGQKHTIEEIQVPEVMKGEDLGESYINIAGLKIPKDELKLNCLVFVPTRKMASENAKNLTSKGYNAGYYFSGEDPTSIRNITAKSPYIIVATNAIESGVTLPDLDVVIDTGIKCEKRVRISDKMPYIVTGLKRMATTIGEQAQRKGRVGRVKPGRYLKGPETVAGEKDYHYDLLQAQMYGVSDGINITKSFREMNYNWSLYEMDTLMISQLEVLNNVILSRDVPITTKNMLTRTTHPEPIQLIYNCAECPVPVLFPIIKGGEVTDKYENYQLMNCRKLGDEPPAYLYSTEDEDLAIDLLNLHWPDPSQQETIEAAQALKQLQGLSSGETALLVALFGWVGYQALTKRHIPIITTIYQIEDAKIEDTTHLQYAPDDIKPPQEIELENLGSNDVGQVIEKIKKYAGDGIEFLKYQTEKVTSSNKDQTFKKGQDLWKKILDYLDTNEKDIKKYGLWGAHTAFFNSIRARLGYETAFASLVIKWIAFGEAGINPLVKQAAVDLLVYYIINKPNYEGDTETQKEGRKFVAATLVSALASYTFNNYGNGQLKQLVEPALSYLPYASKALSLFTPTRLESCVILSTAIYKTYLGIKKGKSDGLAGIAASAAMEIMNQNPISVAIAVALGVGGIAAHNAIESSETKRTLLMKVFVKNFLDQAATDELVKENPEKIILALFEAVQTVGNPIRLIYHLFAIYYKGWSVKELAEKTAGRNIFTLTVFDGLEMLGLDKEGSWRTLSSNYLIEIINKLIKNLIQAPKLTLKWVLKNALPAPFSCTTYNKDERIGWPTDKFEEMEVNCACGYNRCAVKRDGVLVTLYESGSNFCRNKNLSYSMDNIKATTYKRFGNVISPVAKVQGIAQLYYSGSSLEINADNNNTITKTDNWEMGHRTIEKILVCWQGIKYGQAFIGIEPFANGNPIVRREATITKDKIAFLKLEKGCAYTTNLSIEHLKKLIHLVHKNKLPEVQIPHVKAPTWISEALVDENLGSIKPKFGENVLPIERDGLYDWLEPDVTIDESELQVNTPQNLKEGRLGLATFKVNTETGDIKLGLEEGQHPGKKLDPVPLYAKILAKVNQPYIYVFGDKNRMSNRSKTGKFNHLYTDSRRYMRDMAAEGKIIFVQIGNKVHESIKNIADYKVPYLTRDMLQAFTTGPTKKKNLSREQIEVMLGKAEGSQEDLPCWIQKDDQKFLDINVKGETYHLIGDLEELKQKAKELGATKDTKVQTTSTKGIYTVKLSSWWEIEHRENDLEPLFRELLMQCKPTDKIRPVHYASTQQLAKGNLVPTHAEVWQGLVPVKKIKIHPYEAYQNLISLINSKKVAYLDEKKTDNKNSWIFRKVKHPPSLALKNLVNPGALSYPEIKTKRKYNIHNERICSVMQSVGIDLNKLPIVRAQVDTKSFHESIRDKIDKKPNPQNPGLHRELWKVFQMCSIKKYKGKFEEVDWETVESGINRKGAAGFLEKENIGDLIADPKGKKKVENIIKLLKNNKHIQYYETAIPKNEKRAVTEDWVEEDYVEEKKPRVIQYPPAAIRLGITKVMYQWVKQKPIVIPGYEGKTPIFNVFDKVYKEWRSFRDPIAVSFDTKAWDTQVTPKDLKLIGEIQKYYYKNKYHGFIDTITDHMMEVPVITEDGELYIREGQRGSGQPDTSAGNSMLNAITMIYAFCTTNNIPYTSFPKLARIHVCGDDGFLITERKLGEKFSAEGPQLLYEAGKPQKLLEDTGLKLAYEFTDIEFCSHTPITVRWKDGSTSHVAGRDTATILGKMATRLDSQGERGSEEYERSVAFSFLLLYFWNPLIRRICLRVLGETGIKNSKLTTFYCVGDPIGAFCTIYSHRLDQLDRAEFKKLSSLNLNLSILHIWKKNTTQRLLRDCITAGSKPGNRIENADRLVSKKTGKIYEPGEGYVMQGRHYEELQLRQTPKQKEVIGIERYMPGPIKTFILKRLRVLSLLF